ncbi:acyl-CoA synthetase [Pseudohoeflea coraliihabitans]|uniref:AMP-binding protein n=1 Tax=Pseudohoeflea coraliihabitans TaxID=2860393 RepID=A0ABS6WQS2_9HYPH|nr:AMP-binding protein [Pseudohoeflea sp. DP4N28-3]MBW3098317.1 AMP-binding protein [Pseudohoeflea sp. DP4N28-3]
MSETAGQLRLTGDRMTRAAIERAAGTASYDGLIAHFSLNVPPRYNMAADTVLRHSAGPLNDATALLCEEDDGTVRDLTYAQLDDASARVAALLHGHGIGKGDVIACYLGQGLEAALTYLAGLRLGAIIAPLSQLYGPETVDHALNDSGARLLVADAALWARIAERRPNFKQLNTVIIAGATAAAEAAEAGTVAFDQWRDLPPQSGCADTAAEDPALLLYTSGSTGLPKGILHAHRILRGYLASVSLFYELQMCEPRQVLWTASDWSWVAGIFNVMLTGWFFGHTVVASRARFDEKEAFALMQRFGVTHCFLTPTALKRMAGLRAPKADFPDLELRAIGTGGEPLPGAVLDWADRTLNVPINEFYGLTEVNHLIGNCRALYPIKPGSMGRAYPGHTMAVIDENGEMLPDGEEGEIVARSDDPTLFLGYWNQPQRTSAMRIGNWVRTGDFGCRDADGYFWYRGRNDDLIKSAGYRIGPAEIEDALVRHDAVAEAAVVGSPDPDRGQVVKAFIRPARGHSPNDALAKELQQHVKKTLAFYKYPREIEFVTDFKQTSTGKIDRKFLRKREAERKGGQSAR